MSPERAAAVARTERELAEQFEALGLDQPAERAARHVRWLQRNGWRVHPELVDRPAEHRPAPSAVAKAELAAAREAVEAKRGHRPEVGDSCDCRTCNGGRP